MSTFLPRRSGFHHGGRFSRLHSVISRSNQHVYSTHYTSSCTPHVSIISREPNYVMISYDQIEQILNWCGYKILESYKITKRSNGSIINRIFNLKSRHSQNSFFFSRIIESNFKTDCWTWLELKNKITGSSERLNKQISWNTKFTVKSILKNKIPFNYISFSEWSKRTSVKNSFEFLIQ